MKNIFYAIFFSYILAKMGVNEGKTMTNMICPKSKLPFIILEI